VPVLQKILIDPRHDWPTNGAALALLQYSHLSLQETEIFEFLKINKVKETIEGFLDKCRSKDAKRHMYENLTILEMCSKKINSIAKILMQQVYSACA